MVSMVLKLDGTCTCNYFWVTIFYKYHEIFWRKTKVSVWQRCLFYICIFVPSCRTIASQILFMQFKRVRTLQWKFCSGILYRLALGLLKHIFVLLSSFLLTLSKLLLLLILLTLPLYLDDSTGLYSVYTEHDSNEIMFHVSTLLPYAQNNR